MHWPDLIKIPPTSLSLFQLQAFDGTRVKIHKVKVFLQIHRRDILMAVILEELYFNFLEINVFHIQKQDNEAIPTTAPYSYHARPDLLEGRGKG